MKTVNARLRGNITVLSKYSDGSPDLMHTRDYDKFKIIKKNRDVKRTHIRKLQNAMAKHSWMIDIPIVVNENLEVLEGQHRLEAARRLYLPVYFRVAQEMRKDEIPNDAGSRLNWVISEYINWFSEKPSYQLIEKFKERSGFSYECCILFMSEFNTPYLLSNEEEKTMLKKLSMEVTNTKSVTARKTLSDLKAGTYLVSTEQYNYAVNMYIKVNEILLLFPPDKQQKYKKEYRFIRSLLSILNHKKVNYDKFYKKIKSNIPKITPQASLSQYVILLGNIYNNQLKESDKLVFKF